MVRVVVNRGGCLSVLMVVSHHFHGGGRVCGGHTILGH